MSDSIYSPDRGGASRRRTDLDVGQGSGLAGVVRATLDATKLAPCLSGEKLWEATFREARRGAFKGMHLARLPAGTLIAHIPDPRYSREIICTVTPVKEGMVPSFSLKYENGDWRVRPQILMGDCFEQHALIEIERTDWLNAACIQMLGLRSAKATWEPDMTLWEIVSAWPSWQRRGMTWPQRADDLAARLGTVALSPNTLLRKCERMGLEM